jgi:hypothetical protein
MVVKQAVAIKKNGFVNQVGIYDKMLMFTTEKNVG